MKKGLVILLAMVFIFAMAACGGGNQPASNDGANQEQAGGNDAGSKDPEQSSDPIRIGAVFSESGGAASLGKPEMDTLNMLVEQVNEEGGINGRTIELFAYDDKSDQNEAVLITRRLIEQDNVVTIIGGTISGNSMAMIPQVERAEIPYISVAASKQINAPDDGSSRHWTFKTAQGDDVVMPRVLQYLKDNGLTNIAFLNVANPFGSNGHLEFEALKDEFGINELIHEEFEATVTDASAMLTRVRRAEPEAIIVWGTSQESAVVTRNIRDLGIDVPIINSHGIGNMQFIELAGSGAEGVLFPAGRLLVVDELSDDDQQKDLLVTYKNDFESKFDYGASTFGGHAWDAFEILKNALEAVGDDKTAIRDHIENQMKDLVGTGGIFNFSPEDHNGLTLEGLVMIEIKDGNWKIKE